jgi:hypothetical protein
VLGYVQQAFDELRNVVWMLAIPLAMGAITLFGACQWMIQDLRWEQQIKELEQSTTHVIQEVDSSECDQPRPEGSGHICAQSTEWWSPTESTDCEGGQCYISASMNQFTKLLDEMEKSYVPILIPGLIPLIILFVVIRKIKKARQALNGVFESRPPTYPS